MELKDTTQGMISLKRRKKKKNRFEKDNEK